MTVKKLSELCTLIVDCPHSTPIWRESGKIVIRNQFIKEGRLDLSNPSFTDTESFVKRCKRAKPEPGDVIITREAPMGEVCMIPPGLECCLGQRMVLLRVNKSVCDNGYLLYALMSPEVQDQISWSQGTGTTVSNLRIPHLEGLLVPYVPLAKQRAISGTLSCIDEQIDINERINKNLEEQIKAIFNESFPSLAQDSSVGSLPDGWRVGTISELVESISGGDWGKADESKRNTVEAYCIRGTDIPDVIKGVNNLPIRYLVEKIYMSKRLCPDNIVVETSGGSPAQSTGRVALITKAMLERCDKGLVCTNFCKALKPVDGYGYYIFYLWQRLYDDGIMFGYENGTTGLKNFDLKGFMTGHAVVIPTREAVQSFVELVNPFIELIFSNGKQTQTLQEMRTGLLPRIISGKTHITVI